MSEDGTRKSLVPALEKGVRILDHVARVRGFPTVSEIARDLNFPKSTTHALCNTLLELELLIRRSDQTFQLGPHVMRWSNAFTQQSDVATEFATIWDQETELPGATITLSVRDGREVVYIAARNSPLSHPLIEFRAGMRLPAAFTATGKAFLSLMGDSEIRRLYADGLPRPRTPRSVQNIEALLDEVRNIRRCGYSVDNEQVAEGVICFGAPVLDARNMPIAGVAVSVTAEMLEECSADLIIENVQRISQRLSHRMGSELGRP